MGKSIRNLENTESEHEVLLVCSCLLPQRPNLSCSVPPKVPLGATASDTDYIFYSPPPMKVPFGFPKEHAQNEWQEALQPPSWPECRCHLRARNQEASVLVAIGSVLAPLIPSNFYLEPSWAVFMLGDNFNNSFNFFLLKTILWDQLR